MDTHTGSARAAANHVALGRSGERAAAQLLRRLGYRVTGSGFLARRGEIDLVCMKGTELFVVEVKTRSSGDYGEPAEAVHARKRKALGAAAAEYRALSGWRGPIRFAIMALKLSPGGEVLEHELIEDPF